MIVKYMVENHTKTLEDFMTFYKFYPQFKKKTEAKKWMRDAGENYDTIFKVSIENNKVLSIEKVSERITKRGKMAKPTYIIKSSEDMIGSEYWLVKVPPKTLEEDVYKVLHMAGKYANYMDTELTTKEGVEKYDEHYDVMAETVCYSNGQCAFNKYLELHGYSVTSLPCDFVYNW
jgi:hypothetical protein